MAYGIRFVSGPESVLYSGGSQDWEIDLSTWTASGPGGAYLAENDVDIALSDGSLWVVGYDLNVSVSDVGSDGAGVLVQVQHFDSDNDSDLLLPANARAGYSAPGRLKGSGLYVASDGDRFRIVGHSDALPEGVTFSFGQSIVWLGSIG